MSLDLVSAIVGAAVGLVLAYLIHAIWRIGYTRRIRRDAARRSAAVTGGKIFEHLVPFGDDFTYDPRDARFLGSPVDLIVFEGLSAGAVRRIRFVEVKTGHSRLSERERQVREVIEGGDVVWEEIRPD